MLLCALSTDEGAEGDVAVAASVVLAINAEGIKLFFSDSLAEVGLDLATLDIAIHSWFFRCEWIKASLGGGVQGCLILQFL